MDPPDFDRLVTTLRALRGHDVELHVEQRPLTPGIADGYNGSPVSGSFTAAVASRRFGVRAGRSNAGSSRCSATPGVAVTSPTVDRAGVEWAE
ncbi:MAG TPA: hypothetical protein VGV90_14565, partial [Solirubrobacteraceae bacterium]|nr:hypothetical protein [Solirubrobacteraceae bacterium]